LEKSNGAANCAMTRHKPHKRTSMFSVSPSLPNIYNLDRKHSDCRQLSTRLDHRHHISSLSIVLRQTPVAQQVSSTNFAFSDRIVCVFRRRLINFIAFRVYPSRHKHIEHPGQRHRIPERYHGFLHQPGRHPSRTSRKHLK
jgi:hypothetical protein